MIKDIVKYKQTTAEAIRPEFIRLPKAGRLCAHTGLSRSYMNQLVLPSDENGFKPPVRSRSLRKPGQFRGVRLIDFKSLLEYLNGLDP